MSQSARNAIFLEEMGIGAQWKLRSAPELAEDEAATAEPAHQAPPQAAAVQQAPAAVAQQPVARVPEIASAAAMHGDAPAPLAPHARAGVPAGSDAPAPPSVASSPHGAPPVASPATPPDASEPAALDDDSTAWFDEAPAPVRPDPVSDEAIAVMDWAALKTAVATCTRCELCESRRNAVNGRGAQAARWIAISAAPSRLDEKDNQAIAGEAGQLLNNMLKAIELQPENDVYITNLVKCRPSNPDGSDRAPSAEELLACRPFLDRELALTGATMVMTFGQHAARGLMMGPAARGKVMRYGAAELPVVATYHPDDLLRKPEDKAKAWGDLCLAKATHG